MKKLWFLLSAVLTVALVSCGGGGGGISGEPDQPAQAVSVNVIETSATVEVSKTFQFHFSVSNASYPTCTWTVDNVAGGNSTVGTITSEGLYTAPATVPNPNQVTVKATATADTSKSDTATVTISPKLTISPDTVTLNLGATQQFTGNITVDGWRVNEVLWGSSTVGTISQSGLYTAPALLPTPNTVTVSGFSNAQNESASAAVTLVDPKAIAIAPASVTVPAGATQLFTADKNVTWSLVGPAGYTGSIGAISDIGLYTAPLSPPMGGAVTIVATLKSDTTVTATASAKIVFSNASLQGHYAFRYRSAESGGMTFSAGSFVADGAGAISDGLMTMNSAQGLADDVPFTGTYTVGPDGKASVSLLIQGDTVSARFILVSNTTARMMGFGEEETGVGSLDQQDASAFTTGPVGNFVFAYDGQEHACDGGDGQKPISAIGQFTATLGSFVSGYSGINTISNGVLDVNWNGTWRTNGVAGGGQFTGDWGFNPTTGTGGITFGSSYQGPVAHFKYHMLSSDAAVMVSTDWEPYCDWRRWGVTGLLVRPDAGAYSNASLTGNLAMLSYGYVATPTPAVAPFPPPRPVFAAGALSADGSGNITGGLVDNNVNGSVNQSMAVSGTYSIDPSGRGTLTLNAGGSNNHQAFYILGNNSAYSVGIDNWGPAFSQFMPQSGTRPYTVASVGGHFAFTMKGTLSSMGIDAVGQILLDMKGGLTGTLDINNKGVLSADVPVTGAYTIDSTGRGTVTINAPNLVINLSLYLQSTRTLILMGTSSPSLGYLFKQY
jgi:Bacterial Ig-like domain (group 2)